VSPATPHTVHDAYALVVDPITLEVDIVATERLRAVRR